MKKQHTFLEYCPVCKHKHIMIIDLCPECSGRSGQDIPMPKSEKVRESCRYMGYCCDGCDAYKDHLR